MSALINSIYDEKGKFPKINFGQVQNLDSVLSASEWFQRSNGKDHISIMSFFGGDKVFGLGNGPEKERFTNITSCNVVQWLEGEPTTKAVNVREHLIPDRVAFPAMYTGQPACGRQEETFMHVQHNKTQDVVFVGAMVRNNKRCNLCNYRMRFRRHGYNWISHSKWSYAVFGKGENCPHVQEARVGMHFRGDTISASRLIDTILSGTVPVFTAKEQYLAVPDFIDWDKISYFANIENITEFNTSMNSILANRTDIDIKTRNVLQNQDIFDWQSGATFDMYMYYFQRWLYPNSTRLETSQFSALKL
ncbi:predicted protein [Chaetoceros tenuissimus]|uniref:Exostosin GT47 domain-containing protein n=1 Tax=Chaetoceros tenuissimus TaxID=426638 RepID=A0AAD3CYZ6_9STRA|nr:predicted protein [Chaetoceros tenuissimus]